MAERIYPVQNEIVAIMNNESLREQVEKKKTAAGAIFVYSPAPSHISG